MDYLRYEQDVKFPAIIKRLAKKAPAATEEELQNAAYEILYGADDPLEDKNSGEVRQAAGIKEWQSKIKPLSEDHPIRVMLNDLYPT